MLYEIYDDDNAFWEPGHQWLQDRTVAATAWTALVAGVVFVERCFFSRRPLVSLAPFRQKGFTAACLLSFAVGFGIYTSVYLTPLFLARVRGYSSLDIGLTVFIAGLFMMLAAAPAAWLATRIDQRIVMIIGLALYVISFWMMSAAGPEWGFWQLFAPQAVRGAAVLFSMVPVVGMALADTPEAELRDASGFNNLMRSLGGAVGIALVNTWLIGFFALHLSRLSESLASTSGGASDAITALAAHFGQAGVDGGRGALIAVQTLGGGVAAQALALAFDDIFRATAWLFLGCLVILPFCRAGPLQRP